MNTHISVIPLTINDFNPPVKRHRLAEWFKKQSPPICYLEETRLSFSDRHCFRGKKMESVSGESTKACLPSSEVHAGEWWSLLCPIAGGWHYTKDQNNYKERSHSVSKITIYSPLCENCPDSRRKINLNTVPCVFHFNMFLSVLSFFDFPE